MLTARLSATCIVGPSGGSRIFPGGGPTPKEGVLTYFFGRKLYENERIWIPGGRVTGAPLRSANGSSPHHTHPTPLHIHPVWTHPPLNLPDSPRRDLESSIPIPQKGLGTSDTKPPEPADTCENITFPQLLLRAAITNYKSSAA